MMMTDEKELEDVTIEQWFAPEFFESQLWYYWCAMLTFRPYHSLIEMKRYAVRFMHQLHLIRNLRGILRTKYDQYNSLILPLQKYLADNGVNFVANTTVIDMDFENVDNKKSVKTLRILQGDEEKFVCSPEKSNFVSVTVTVKDYPKFFEYLEEKTGNPTGKGGATIFAHSPWFITYGAALQPICSDQPDNVQVLWFYGLHSNEKGEYIKKTMNECDGEEVLREFLYHCGLESEMDKIVAH